MCGPGGWGSLSARAGLDLVGVQPIYAYLMLPSHSSSKHPLLLYSVFIPSIIICAPVKYELNCSTYWDGQTSLSSPFLLPSHAKENFVGPVVP